MGYTYAYPKADNTVDMVVFGLDPTDKGLRLLLIQRKAQPFADHWALPGGFVDIHTDPSLDHAALRELREEAGITPKYIEQLATFGDLGRDPRGRVISTAYLTLVRPQDVTLSAGDDASDAQWFPVNKLPPLAFDHGKIVKTGIQRLRSKVRWQPVGIELLPEEFTLSDLQRVYEAILGQKLDKRNFRKKVEKFGVMKPTGKTAKEHRQGPPAKLFKFDRRKYARLQKAGIDFEV